MITYSKLKDGSWALRGPAADLVQGETVIVHKRGGETRRERVGRVLYTMHGQAVALISQPIPENQHAQS